MAKIILLAGILIFLCLYEYASYRYNKYRYNKYLSKQEAIAHMYQDINDILVKYNIVRDEDKQ